jgi:hypothetical protein
MDVVDRYLLNVRAFLPGGAQEDFVAELRENIRSQVEDREENLGRPLTEVERIAILRAHGHPLLVAGAYRSDGRRLVLGREVIGPALFPFYRLALIGAGSITIPVMVFGGVASALGGGPPFPGLRTAVFYLSVLATVATLVFAGLDAWFRRTAQTWDPHKLPASSRIPVTPTARRIQAAIQVVAILALLWLWLTVISSALQASAAAHDMRLGQAWRFLHLGVTASTALSLLTPALTLLRPAWHRFRWLVSLFSSGAFIAFASASLWNHDWLLPGLALDAHDALEVADRCQGINRGIVFGLAIGIVLTALVTVFEVVQGAWREYRRAGNG